MIDALIYVVILCIIFGLILWAIGQLPLPAPMGQVARVVLIVIFVLLLLFQLLPLLHSTAWRHG